MAIAMRQLESYGVLSLLQEKISREYPHQTVVAFIPNDSVDIIGYDIVDLYLLSPEQSKNLPSKNRHAWLLSIDENLPSMEYASAIFFINGVED